MKKIIVLFLLLSQVSFAQNIDFAYKHLGIEEGLPSNTIYSVSQDKDGFMWFGTNAGVTCFDGINFKTYTTKDGLPSNEVFNVFCDSENKLWLITYSNAICYIHKSKIHNQINDTVLKKLHLQDRISHITENAKKQLIIIENGNLVYILKNNKLVLQNIYPATVAPHLQYFYRWYQLDSNLIFSGTSTILYDTINGFKIHNLDINKKIIKMDDAVITSDKTYMLKNGKIIIIDSKDFLYNNTKLGIIIGQYASFLFKIDDSHLFITNTDGFKIYNIINKTISNNYLLNQKISYVFVDKMGNIFISTLHNGVYIIQNKNATSLKESMEIDDNVTMSINVSQPQLLFGNGESELRILVAGIKSKKITLKVANPKFNVGDFRILKIEKIKDEFYILNDISIFHFNKNFKELNNANDANQQINIGAFKDFAFFNNYLYFTTHRGVFKATKSLHILKQLYTNYTQAITSYQNNVYTSSLNKIYKVVGDTIVESTIPNPIKTRIIQYYNDDDRQLIIATAEDGLYKLCNHKITPFLAPYQTLSSNNCNKIIKNNNQYYVATKNGITIIDSNHKVLRYIYKPDGLASNNVNDLTIQNDTLYAATDKGVSIIDLLHLPISKFDGYFINPTIVGKDTLWQNRMDGSAPIAINSYDDVPIKFLINSINFSTDGKFLHHYRIPSIDTTWSITEDKFIDIKNLPPAEYMLETYATNSYGLRSKLVLQKFVIQPYFFQRKLVRFGILLGICFLLYLLYKRRTKYLLSKEKSKRELETKISTLELASWRAKINPHFIFNALNAMQSIFVNKDFELANTYLANFSNVLRKTIVNSGEILTTVSHEISYLQSYLSLEEIKRNTNFSYTIDVENQILQNYYIPSMVIQPIIENSLKHGIKAKKNGHIGIHFSIVNEALQCIITDNGVGFGNSTIYNSTSKGNLLIQEKLEIIERLSNAKTVFVSKNKLDDAQQICGTETIFTFPIQTSNITIHDSNNN